MAPYTFNESASLLWQWANPAFYDRLMHECLSWRFIVSPYRSGGTERGNNPKSRVERFGRRMGRWNRKLAIPLKALSSYPWSI
jgi:hypothetical protein